MQCSDQLITPNDEMRRYYSAAYSRMPGYVLPAHYFEIPFWIPLCAGLLPASEYTHELHVIEDLDGSVAFMRSRPHATFLFSVLEANVAFVRRLAERSGAPIVVGGYTNPSEFAHLPNVRYLAGIDELEVAFDIVDPEGLTDYRMFAGQECIPRMSLSTGCSFRCTFCTVPTTVLQTPPERVSDLAATFEPLTFRLIFLDDKSFGDASNWESICEVHDTVRAYNPDFEGFIIQTPPSLAARPGFLERCAELGVRYVEFGVETVDASQLRRLRKPYRRKHLDRAMELAASLDLGVIPNLIIGIPGDDTEQTVAWIQENVQQIPVVNVNWLAVHYANERGDPGVTGQTIADRDQNSRDKTWLTCAEAAAGWDAARRMYDATCPGWHSHDAVALSLVS
jgi:hypothetical protein